MGRLLTVEKNPIVSELLPGIKSVGFIVNLNGGKNGF